MATVQLSNKAIGDKIKISINGTARSLIVAQKGKPSAVYDNSFDQGVLVLLEDIYENRQWNTTDVNNYATSTINTWLNSTFFNLIPEGIRNKIIPVKIPYYNGTGASGYTSSGANGLQCRIFLLSHAELNFRVLSGASPNPQDGATLSLFSDASTYEGAEDPKRIAYLDGVASPWRMRTPHIGANTNVWSIQASGAANSAPLASASQGIRPAFLLPYDTMIADDGTVIVAPPPAVPTSINYGDPRAGEDILITLGF